MALGLPNGIPFCWQPPVKTASDIESSPNLRISADGGVSEFSNGCLDGRVFSLVQASPVGVLPSLLVVPQSYKSGKLYAQLPNARVNHIPNNSMFGASGGVLPSGWTFSVGAASGVSLGYSASGQVTAEDGTLVDYIDFTFSGTATASGFLNLRPNASPSTISSVSGQSWNASVYFQLISGSVASISPTYQLQETTSGGTFINGSNITGLGSLTTSLPLRRYNVTRDLDTSGTVVTCRWGHSIASGTTYNYTLRIASPQLENLSSPTSVIRTVSGAVYAPYSGAAPGGSTIASIADFTVSRNTTATRVNSSGLIESVASGVPRIDWLGQSCPGLLVEPSAQNLVPSGLVFNSAAGVLYDTAVSDSPAVSINSARITKNEASGTIRYASQNCSTSALAGSTTYTISRFFKYDGVDFATSMEYNNTAQWGGTAWNQVINIASSGVTLGTSSSCTGSVENYGNGWYRVAIRITTGASPSGSPVTYLMRLPAALSTGQGFLTALPQLETGAIPTSYIPTTTGQATRAADVVSVSGVSGYIGQTEGTLYAEFEMRTDTSTRRILTLSDGSQANRIMLVYSSNALRAQIQGTAISLGNPADGFHKVAFAYEQNGASGTLTAILDGGAVVSGTSATYPTSLNTINLGKIEDTTTTSQINSRIRAAAIYTTRLPNAQLAELTRL